LQWLSCRLLSPWHKKLPLLKRPLLLKLHNLPLPQMHRLQKHLPLKPLPQKLSLPQRPRLQPKSHSLLPKRPLLQLPLQKILKHLQQPRLLLKLHNPLKRPPLQPPPQKLQSLQNLNRLPPPLPTLRVRRVLPKACAWGRLKRPLLSFTEALTILSRTKPQATTLTFSWTVA
jgi:hypothetical protein